MRNNRKSPFLCSASSAFIFPILSLIGGKRKIKCKQFTYQLPAFALHSDTAFLPYRDSLINISNTGEINVALGTIIQTVLPLFQRRCKVTYETCFFLTAQQNTACWVETAVT